MSSPVIFLFGIIILISVFVLIFSIIKVFTLLKQKNKITPSMKNKDSKSEEEISYRENDITLVRGKTYQIGNQVAPGKYRILSIDSNAKEFNIRLGGFVRGYKKDSQVVLVGGDEITSVSHNIILR